MNSQFQIMDKIASGGMADIFLARSHTVGVGRFLAVKKIRPELSEQQDYLEMFKTEAKVAMQLQHRNLVSIYDFNVDDGQCYLLMELVSGLNLSQILLHLRKNLKTIPVDVALFIVAEVAAGLQKAHEITIHRDVSPQNIMVGYNGDVKVIDFGVAKNLADDVHTSTGIMKGKLTYMSPEQIHCQPIDHRSDIFSLGVVLYEILAQKRVYKGTTDLAVAEEMKKEIRWLSEENPKIDEDLGVIVHRALRMNVGDRYASMDGFHRALLGYMQEKFPQFDSAALGEFMKLEFAKEHLRLQEKLFDLANILKPRNYVPPESLREPAEPVPELTMIVNEKTEVVARAGPVSMKVCKKFRIKYAYQRDPAAAALYEMHSLMGADKRGEPC